MTSSETILLCHMALDSLLNTYFFTFHRKCQRPVALQLQLQRDIHSWISTSEVLNLIDSEFCLQCKLYLGYLIYFTDCWLLVCFLVMWSLIYSFLNLFWRSKIRQRGLVKCYFENADTALCLHRRSCPGGRMVNKAASLIINRRRIIVTHL